MTESPAGRRLVSRLLRQSGCTGRPEMSVLEQVGLGQVLDLEVSCVPGVSAMERWGVMVDVRALRPLRSECRSSLARSRVAWRSICRRFGLGSVGYRSDPACLSALPAVGLPVDDVRARTLSQIEHPVAEALLAVRGHQKRLDEVERVLRCQRRGVLRGRFDQVGTVTGRMSAKSYNLMGFPGRLRRHVTARDGSVFLYADYVAADLTVLAGLSGDPELRRILASGRDLYVAVGIDVFGLDEDEIDAEVRGKLKVVVLAIGYGMTAWRLQKELECSKDEAEGILTDLKEAFPVAEEYLSAQARRALGGLESRTPLGRRRVYPSSMRRDELQRKARNFAVQAHGADVFKERLAVLHALLESRGWGHLVLTLHDGFLMEIYERHVDEAVPEIRRVLQRSPLLEIPMRVTIGCGTTWAEAEENLIDPSLE